MNVAPTPNVPGAPQNQLGDDAAQQPAQTNVNAFSSPPEGMAGGDGFLIDGLRGPDGGGKIAGALPRGGATSNPWGAGRKVS